MAIKGKDGGAGMIEYDLKAFGARIRTARENVGFSQVDLAYKAGITSNTVQCMEAGKTMSMIVNLEAVADALKVSIDDLIGRKGYQTMVPFDCLNPGERIKMRREQLGFTKQYLIDKGVCSKEIIRRLEQGRLGRTDSLVMVADELSVAVDWILGRVNDEAD